MNQRPTTGVVRTSRQYAQMAEYELADEAELKVEQAELDGRPDNRRDLRLEDVIRTERDAHLRRAGVYARLAQAAAALEV